MNRMNTFKLCFAFIILSALLNATTPIQEGLPLFWWKEGNFVNFGDYLSYKMVERIAGSPLKFYNKDTPNQDKKLLGSGSIYYFANEGDVVWGSGINGKRLDKNDYKFTNLDIRSVRGPLTREFLQSNFGIITPEIYGDPALLFPYLFPEFKRAKNPEHDYIVIVHYLDIPFFTNNKAANIIYATESWDIVIRAILNSKFVISSSLHGLVIAEAYGIPARYLRLGEAEPLFKFYDYYQGTGRSSFESAHSIHEALLMGGEPKIKCDLEKIYQAFPFEFWPSNMAPAIDFTKEVNR